MSSANQPAWFWAKTTGPARGTYSIPSISQEKYFKRTSFLSTALTFITNASRPARSALLVGSPLPTDFREAIVM